MYMSATSDTHVVSNTTTVDPGESFTFSAYVKVVSGTFRLAISDRVKISILAYGEVVPVSNEWTRYEVSVTNNTTETMTVAPTLRLLAGTQVYIDCAQGELAATASRVNLITNGDFRFVASNPPFTWAATGLDSAVDKAVAVEKSAAPELDVNAFSITGSPTKKKRLATVVAVNGSEGDTLILSGWAKGNAAPDDMEGMEPDGTVNDRVFGLVATINYTDGSTEKVTATFNPDVENWQYTATPIVPQKAYTSVKVELTYDYNVNTVLFDGIQLYKEEFGSSYTYDDEGNVISVVDLQKKETTYEYDTSGNLTKVMQDNKAKMTYTYDDYHNVETATSAEGLAYSFVYDTYGNKTVKISYR